MKTIFVNGVSLIQPRIIKIFLIPLVMVMWLLTACQAEQASRQENESLKVVATTNIVGDVVAQIGGELIDLYVLLPPGTDPHSYQPIPQDVARVSEADLVFANGAGLEEFLQPMLKNAGGQHRVVEVSEGIKLLDTLHIEGASRAENDQAHTAGDPHTWFDPNNVILWVQNINQALNEADPQHAADFDVNAQSYITELETLDRWIQQQVEMLPSESRRLVTDHTSLTYFANRYGFELVGAVIPAYSTLAEPSAQELAALEETISKLNVKAVFVGESTNPALAEQVSQDLGIQLVKLYNGSLSAPGGPASTYLEFMKYNLNAIIGALK